MSKTLKYMFFVWLALSVSAVSWGAVKLPAIFGDHMVLQRDAEVRIWGWDAAGQEVTVRFAGQSKTASAGADGKWEVKLAPLEGTAVGRDLKVEGSSSATFKNVVVGEVWVCSGQSNMQWPVNSSVDADLEKLTAHYPQIRLISVPRVGSQERQDDFEGSWVPCTPEAAEGFSAVGYFYGRLLHEALGVPVGLINNAWGGSAAEAWLPREVLAKDQAYAPYLSLWESKENNLEANTEVWLQRLEAWKKNAAKMKAAGKTPPKMPPSPLAEMGGQHRPGNLYNGVLHPIIGYGIRGVIWYQGESNAARAANYRELFPLMIGQWRKDWGQGDFPFYWVQLADFRAELPEPAESDWAELRESQTVSLQLPNTGQAVIYDLGEAEDIHPKDKQNVAKRLARHALAKVHGMNLAAESPRYASHEIQGDKVLVHFDHVGGGLDSFDTAELRGFAVAGADRKFVWAEAKVVDKDTIEVWSLAVPSPAAVRYAWADNPVANVRSAEGLPLTPFRSDDWPMITARSDS